uniref:Envelope protein n=1 Tax=Chalana errantivirus TaxID=3078400 RepID=A0AB38Z2D5_9VIRU
MIITTIGPARIKEGHVRILHPINIKEIENVISKLYETYDNRISNPLTRLVEAKTKKLLNTYTKIKPRIRRTKRWDTIGKAFKWLAGSPDADDLRAINSTMNNLILQNNKQIIINDRLDNRLQEITTIANNILKTEEMHKTELTQLVMLANLDNLQDYTEAIEDAILLARKNIPSSKLFSLKDFQSIETQLNGPHSLQEILMEADAQAILNDTHVIYMLKIPHYSNASFEYNFIDSVIKDGRRILLRSNYILCNESHVIELAHPCEPLNNIYVCESIHTKPATECIANIIQQKHSSCDFEKVYGNNVVKRINEETIFINDGVNELSSTCSKDTKFLNGSFIIHMNNCSVRINGETYENMAPIVREKNAQSIVGITISEESLIDEPPQEFLKNLTLLHRDKLKLMHLTTNSIEWKTNIFGSFSILSVLSVIIIIYCISQKKTTVVKINSSTQPETFEFKPATVCSKKRGVRNAPNCSLNNVTNRMQFQPRDQPSAV